MLLPGGKENKWRRVSTQTWHYYSNLKINHWLCLTEQNGSILDPFLDITAQLSRKSILREPWSRLIGWVSHIPRVPFITKRHKGRRKGTIRNHVIKVQCSLSKTNKKTAVHLPHRGNQNTFAHHTNKSKHLPSTAATAVITHKIVNISNVMAKEYSPLSLSLYGKPTRRARKILQLSQSSIPVQSVVPHFKP